MPIHQSGLLALALSILLGLSEGCDYGESPCGAYLPGDIMLGVLMPSHTKVQDLHNRTRPDGYPCTDFDLMAWVKTLAVIQTIEEINALNYIPGIRLGYLVCDTCSDTTKALHMAEYMLAANGSLSVQCNYTDFRPAVKVIMGARFSEVSIALAKLLSVYMVPQVSCTSSSPALSDKLRYPAFLRTIPSDKHQTKAFAKLMARFNWTYVGVVYTDDAYGKAAFQKFVVDAEEMGVCVAYKEMVPHYLGQHSKPYVKRVAEKIRSLPEVHVVLLILRGELVGDLFKEMMLTNTSRTWIASDSWIMNRPVANIEGINEVGDIFGFSFVTGKSKSFDDYLRNLKQPPGGYNRFMQEYKNLRFNCTADCSSKNPLSYCHDESVCNYEDPQEANDDFIVRAVDTSESHAQRVAVWAVANALKQLLQCNASICPGEVNFPPWRLLEELKKVHFSLDGQEYLFDEHGDFVDGYNLMMWVKNGDKRDIQKRGRYSIKDGQLTMSKINWLSTPNNTVPVSRCSLPCAKGEFKTITNVSSCCYTCLPCKNGTFSDELDLSECKTCADGETSLSNSSVCSPWEETYLGWSDKHPIALVAAAGFGVLLLLFILSVFLVHRDSPPMRRAEVRLSCVMIAGLAASFASVACFMGKPNVHLCRARQVTYAMGFTLCVSCILVKAFRTFLAFLPFGQLRHRRLNRLYKPPVIVAVITAMQGVICLLWVCIDSPHDDTMDQGMKKIFMCKEGSGYVWFSIMLSYIALLALVGFLLAFKGRKVPQAFSETGYIIFSMLMYLFVWVCFIPLYIVKVRSGDMTADPLAGSTVQASAILVSSYGVIFCHFMPKCYEALWGSKEDTLDWIMRRVHSVATPRGPRGVPDVEADSQGDRDSGVAGSRPLDSPSAAGPKVEIIPTCREDMKALAMCVRSRRKRSTSV